jgi:hypothetical protein
VKGDTKVISKKKSKVSKKSGLPQKVAENILSKSSSRERKPKIDEEFDYY